MAGCTGCLISEKERQAMIDALTIKVKNDAISNQKNYILYNLPDNSVNYMEFEAARSAGVQPFKFISKYQPDADGGVS